MNRRQLLAAASALAPGLCLGRFPERKGAARLHVGLAAYSFRDRFAWMKGKPNQPTDRSGESSQKQEPSEGKETEKQEEPSNMDEPEQKEEEAEKAGGTAGAARFGMGQRKDKGMFNN